MKVSIESIKKYTEVKIPTEELVEKVFTQIAAVEGVEDLTKKYTGILIAKILSKEDHPDSDRLAVYQVDLGDRKEQVVAGDKTLEVGDTVAYFQPGTKLPNNPHPEKNEDVVKKIKLRGVESNGMLASARELDFGTDHTHVLRLDKDLKVGETILKAYNLNDTILDIENKALANRGDCFGIIGLAREISAIQDFQFNSPDWFRNPNKELKKSKNLVTLSIQNNSQINCPRYMGVIISGIKISDSPIWMQVELSKAGIKPINNVVDVTNYIMLTLGQPMHAFDLNKVMKKDKNSKDTAFITIRNADNGEKIIGINDKEIELDDTMTVICDSQNPIALAGVIGGKDTEIDEKTTSIILESANFNRYNIRKTSWKTGIATDAVTRYTKAIDPNMCEIAIYHAISLITQLTNGEVSSEVIDVYPDPVKEKSIYINLEKFNIASGLSLSEQEVKNILENLEYKVKVNKENIEVIVPTFRTDVTIAEDIYEDIERIYGFNKIPIKLPYKTILPPVTNKFVHLKYKIRDIFSNAGANEILTYNFISESLLEKYGFSSIDAYHLINALSPELEYMRVTPLISILEKAKENIERGFNSFRLFEINIGHNKKEIDSNNLPLERWTLSFVNIENSKKKPEMYYESKVYLDHLFEKLNSFKPKHEIFSNVETSSIPKWISIRQNMLDMNRSAIISVEREGKKQYLGLIGELNKTIKQKDTQLTNSSFFEIDLHELLLSINPNLNYTEPSKYPKISQDICFELDIDIPVGNILEELENILSSYDYISKVSILDIYSKDITKGSKQITFRISLQSSEKTLENKEYESVKNKIVSSLNTKFKANTI